MPLNFARQAVWRLTDSNISYKLRTQTLVGGILAGNMSQNNRSEDIEDSNTIQMFLMKKSDMDPIDWIMKYAEAFRKAWDNNLHEITLIERELYYWRL